MKITLYIIFFLVASITYAAPGDLDTTFGNAGIAIESTPDGSNMGTYDGILQKDGSIVAVGSTYFVFNGYSIALVRFNKDGQLDTTFGTGGWTITNFGYYSTLAIAAATQTDVKIVVVGQLEENGKSDMFVARFLADGAVDSSFGTEGLVIIDLIGTFEEAHDVAIQGDQKIVVVGPVYTHVGLDFAIVRLNTDGTRDLNFGQNGFSITDFYGFSDDPSCVAIQPDRKIVVGGLVKLTSTNGAFGGVRYRQDGSLDPLFGSGGKVETDFFARDDMATSIALQTDGKIVLSGFSQRFTPSTTYGLFTFVRYNINGSVNITKVESYGGSLWEGSNSVVIATNGRILSAGGADDPSFSDSSSALTCHTTTGALDNAFGNAGWVITATSPAQESISQLLLQPDGLLIAIGSGIDGNGLNRVVVARYYGCGQ
ncbi:hypothetical protein L0156_06360 [bacterium]|nr:hypothetical protein [bacterium]